MNHERPMRLSLWKRTAFVAVLTLGPLGTACELFFEFDRTPLQPQYEAGADEDEDDGGSTPTPRRDSGGTNTPRDSGGDTSSASDADAQGG